MKCKYCQTFAEIDQKDWTTSKYKNKVFVEKKCPCLGIKVENTSKKCGNFTTNNFFWCDNYDQRYHILVCVGRQKKDMCEYCQQGEEVKSVARIAGLLEPVKPIINRNGTSHKPIVQTHKPIIKRKQIIVRRTSI